MEFFLGTVYRAALLFCEKQITHRRKQVKENPSNEKMKAEKHKMDIGTSEKKNTENERVPFVLIKSKWSFGNV